MKILIADKFEQSGIDQLKKLGCEVLSNPELKDAALTDAMKQTQPSILIVRSTKVAADAIQATDQLKLIIRAGSGYNTIDVKAATAANVRVANCPGMNAVAVAELAFGLMLALDRRLVHNAVDLRNKVWNKKEYSNTTKALGMKDATLGVIGLGQIGVEIARRAKAFDMQLIYSDVVTNDKAEKELGIRKVSMDQLIKEADYITLHVPLNDATKHMISTEQFKQMKSTSVIINCSRGGVIDQAAMVDAINNGQLRGAGLDVFEIEPAATDKEFADPVVACDRVYGTHHIGASTAQAQAAVADETVRIVDVLMKSGDVCNCVNPV